MIRQISKSLWTGFVLMGDGFNALGEGMASLFDFGARQRTPYSHDATRLYEEAAIRSDWEAVGGDMRKAIAELNQVINQNKGDVNVEN